MNFIVAKVIINSISFAYGHIIYIDSRRCDGQHKHGGRPRHTIWDTAARHCVKPCQ